MRIRNKLTGQIHEVMEGTLYDKNSFEEVKGDEVTERTPDTATKNVNEKAEKDDISQENVNEETKEEKAKKPAKTAKSANKKKGGKKNELKHE